MLNLPFPGPAPAPAPALLFLALVYCDLTLLSIVIKDAQLHQFSIGLNSLWFISVYVTVIEFTALFGRHLSSTISTIPSSYKMQNGSHPPSNNYQEEHNMKRNFFRWISFSTSQNTSGYRSINCKNIYFLCHQSMALLSSLSNYSKLNQVPHEYINNKN